METFINTYEEIRKLGNLLDDPVLNHGCKIAIMKQLVSTIENHTQFLATLQEEIISKVFPNHSVQGTNTPPSELEHADTNPAHIISQDPKTIPQEANLSQRELHTVSHEAQMIVQETIPQASLLQSMANPLATGPGTLGNISAPTSAFSSASPSPSVTNTSAPTKATLLSGKPSNGTTGLGLGGISGLPRANKAIN